MHVCNCDHGKLLWRHVRLTFSPVSVDCEIVLVYLSQLVRWSCEEWCSPRNWTKTRDNWMINSLFLTFQTYSTFSDDSSTANPSSTVQEDWRTRTKYSSREKLEKKIKVQNFRNMCFGGKCTFFLKLFIAWERGHPKWLFLKSEIVLTLSGKSWFSSSSSSFFIIFSCLLDIVPWLRMFTTAWGILQSCSLNTAGGWIFWLSSVGI